MMISVVDYDHIYVHLVNMDTCVHEMVRHTPTDDYVIFINARISDDAQREAFEHAVDHIRNNDFEKSSVQQIEAEAHGLVPRQEVKPIKTYRGNRQVEAWLKRVTSDHEKIRRQLDARWRRNNRRAEMGFDFFDSELEKLENRTE
jgi:hypothetical protein